MFGRRIATPQSDGERGPLSTRAASSAWQLARPSAPAVLGRRSVFGALRGAACRWVVGVALVHPVQVTELLLSGLWRSFSSFEPHYDVGHLIVALGVSGG